MCISYMYIDKIMNVSQCVGICRVYACIFVNVHVSLLGIYVCIHVHTCLCVYAYVHVFVNIHKCVCVQ